MTTTNFIRRALQLVGNPKEVRRLVTLRCAHCGHPFRWALDPRHSFGMPGEVYHGPCISYVIWRRKADERLQVLGVAVELGGITADDLRDVMGQRQPADGWNLAWRVLRDLEER